MRRQRAPGVLCLLGMIQLPAGGVPDTGPQAEPSGRTFFVRQSVGDDRSDGLSPATAWRSLGKLSAALRAGDTAYVGPGLYREQLVLANGGTPGRRITLIADGGGRMTGDASGVVVVSGADPVDEGALTPTRWAGVYSARLRGEPVHGVVEMDGTQFPFVDAAETREHTVDGMEPRAVVGRLRSSFFYDPASSTLYLHTSGDGPPGEHEIEVVRRTSGIYMWGKPYVTVSGFTVRHAQSGAITFGRGSDHGLALGNRCFGSHQGIQVLDSDHVVVSGNTLFRNDNSGVYFLSGSEGGLALGNVLYENVKGIRWGSESDRGTAAGNTTFANVEAGISLERVTGLRLIDNRLVGNQGAQLRLIEAEHEGEGNCYGPRGPEQLVVHRDREGRYARLAELRAASGTERSSTEGECGPLPAPVEIGDLPR